MKRVLAMLLCVLLLGALLPVQALADSYGPGIKLPAGTYQTVSTKEVKLVGPREKDLLDEPLTKVVKSCGRLFLMPTPYDGNGWLDVVNDGEEVTILAEYGFMYFFETQDGRYGWNGKIYFVDPEA